jgi:hypothetical protein
MNSGTNGRTATSYARVSMPSSHVVAAELYDKVQDDSN